jgi:LIM homeobox protein 2/9
MSGMGAEFNQIMDSPINGYGLGSLSHHGGDLGVNMNLGGDGIQGQQQKGKRMRTTFKHNQLRIMKSYFEMNPNPDTKDLKQLSQKTGLCKRVLQVWFQNARAKHRRSCPRSESSMSGENSSVIFA